MKISILLAACACALQLFALQVTVDPAKAVILQPANAPARVRSGAEELQKHIELITGVKVPVKEGTEPVKGVYSFVIGTPEPGADRKFAIEEARWIIGESAAYIYGDDSFARRGSEAGVINFLDKQLGVKWIEPGDDGIVYKESAVLKLQSGKFKWIPELLVRCVRCYELPKSRIPGLEGFNFTKEEQAARFSHTRRWQYRMLMCFRTNMFVFGHAFTKWWGMYGKDHPEYFAVNRTGKRSPESSAKNIFDAVAVGASARTIKMCVSNPGLVKQVAANFLAAKPRPEYVNLCENDDVGGYCRCEACLALDTVKNQKLDSNQANLTDRYLHFVNAVSKELEQYNINISWYAYNQTKLPPLREKVAKNVVIGTVPSTLDVAELDKYYKDWKRCGATRFTLRPNYHWILMQTGMPMGVEKLFYDILDTAIKNGAIGADFDASQCHWSVNGIVDYILFRKMGHPEKSFEELENEYYSAFGEAAADVKEFFHYYRKEIFNKRLLPNREGI